MSAENNIFLTEPVTQAQKGARLDKFLAESLPFSRAQIQNLLKAGALSKDETEITDASYKIKEGDCFCLCVPPLEEAEPEPENIPLDIVYEDQDVVVVNKPAGQTVHPAPGAYHGTLVNALLYHLKGRLSGIGGVKRPGIVHRIDKETSGLLVVAKNDLAHQKLSEQFFNHSIERTYYAVVFSHLNPPEGKIEGNIGRSKFDRQKMALLSSGGKPAVTHYQTVERFGLFASLVKCNLETGRTHQIRVHLSSKGCHLVGDKIYSVPKITSLKIPADLKDYLKNFPRQALHAATLGFIHPRTGKFLSFEAPFPEDFKNLLTALHNGVYQTPQK